MKQRWSVPGCSGAHGQHRIPLSSCSGAGRDELGLEGDLMGNDNFFFPIEIRGF